MFLAQILLPLYDNDKRIFSKADFEGVRDELATTFGGVTAFLRSPAEGIWRKNVEESTGNVHHDEVVMLEVMMSALDRGWWQRYREGLEGRFRQDEIVVRIIQFERL